MPRRATPPTPAGQYSIWLLPEPEHEARLVETVARLSVLMGGPGFAPHVTVQGDIALPLQQLRGHVQRMAADAAGMRWPVRQVECTAHFFRCLYLRFDSHPVFARLQRAARRCTGTPRGLSPFPHLSLAYGVAHPDNARMGDILGEEFLSWEIVFDRIAICRSSSTVPIPQWECLVHYPLPPH